MITRWRNTVAGLLLAPSLALASTPIQSEIDADHLLLKRFVSQPLAKGYTTQPTTVLLNLVKKNGSELRLIRQLLAAKPGHAYDPIFLLREAALSTRGAEWMNRWCASCHANGIDR